MEDVVKLVFFRISTNHAWGTSSWTYDYIPQQTLDDYEITLETYIKEDYDMQYDELRGYNWEPVPDPPLNLLRSLEKKYRNKIEYYFNKHIVFRNIIKEKENKNP